MATINRREWLRSSGILGGLMLGGLPAIETLAEERKFYPRPFNGTAKLNSNENPYGPSEFVRKAMTNAFDDACRYPFSYTDGLMEQIAAKEGVSTDHIVITGGSTEGLKITGLVYGLDSGEIIAPRPTFLAMLEYAGLFGAEINWVDVDENLNVDLEEMERRITNRTRLIFLCNPNNPTSTLADANQVMDFCESVSNRVTVFSDEAYYDFIDEPNYPSMIELVKKGANVIVSRTFSKVYGLAGMRIGYLVARPDIAEMLQRRVVAFTNVLALIAASAALKDKDFYEYSLKQNRAAKKIIYSALDDLGLRYLKSHTNFVFFHTGRPIQSLIADMRDEDVQIGRPFPPFTDWCRISTGTIEEVEQFAKGIKKVLG